MIGPSLCVYVQFDEDAYPEVYRKSTDYIKGSNEFVPEPFRIGRITKIFCKRNANSKFHNLSELKLQVLKFYR